MIKVFLTGGDEVGWALDEDLNLMRKVLRQMPEISLTDLKNCDIVHSCSPGGLHEISDEQLAGKKVICHMPGEPFRYLQQPDFPKVASKVGLWVARTQQAVNEFKSLNIQSTLVPYIVDEDVFYPLAHDGLEKNALRERLNLPKDSYLIGSFQRDTEGADLITPKYMKGPDVFFEIVHSLHRKLIPIHVLLAGPRRFWLIKNLEEAGIPYTYVGRHTSKDDIFINTLPRQQLNELYNSLDCYIVSSRSEGGPHAVLEALSSGCSIISTPVGVSLDVLPQDSLFSTVADAVDKVVLDMKRKQSGYASPNPIGIGSTLNLTTLAIHLEQCYRNVHDIKSFKAPDKMDKNAQKSKQTGWLKFPKLIKSGAIKTTTVGLWHTYHKPPYGGGNQFMLAMRKQLALQGVNVIENKIQDMVDYYFLNSIHFDVDAFTRLKKNRDIKVLHRIDGPIYLIRGYDREKDELCYRLNAELASATVLQSTYVYRKIVEFGYQPINPVIIHNAVDPEIFNRKGKLEFDTNRKIRLISSSWSNNPRKGGSIYKWIEENLNWDLFEYTFVGNVSEPLGKIKHLPPMPSEDLAVVLKEHDIYITASENDPCSNALIEALSCGLPALYLNSGGHPELVGMGGLPFENVDEILKQLERIVEDYESFRNLIVVQTMDQVVKKYLDTIRTSAA